MLPAIAGGPHLRNLARLSRQAMTALVDIFLRLRSWQIIACLLSISVGLGLVELLFPKPLPHAVLGPISPAVAYALYVHRYLYIIPLIAMAWFVNRRWAYFNAVVITGILTIIHFGADFISSRDWVPLLNGANRLVFYTFLIEIISRLKLLQTNLEALADSRAQALAGEAARNLQLQCELLEAGQREQQRIGQDLHDGLCQHLTGTAIASQFLFENLDEEGHPHSAYAGRIVRLIENGIRQTRAIAKGLYPIDMDNGSLMRALEDFTTDTSDLFGINCNFACETPILVEAPSTANHLYRIAQEAVSNALRHGKATKIEISLEESDSGIRLSIADNGAGLPGKTSIQKGLGLRTMTDRAKSMGGELVFKPSLMGGLEVVCQTPAR
jgi:signal transduction histidine kinase